MELAAATDDSAVSVFGELLIVVSVADFSTAAEFAGINLPLFVLITICLFS